MWALNDNPIVETRKKSITKSKLNFFVFVAKKDVFSNNNNGIGFWFMLILFFVIILIIHIEKVENQSVMYYTKKWREQITKQGVKIFSGWKIEEKKPETNIRI